MRASPSLSRTSGTDGALTWEVPPALEPSFGAPPLPDSPAPHRASGGGAAAAAAAAAAVEDGEAAAALVGSLTGLHSVVVRNRFEFAAAARAHLRLLIEQLLRAEEVGAWRAWAPVVERLAVEAAGTVQPAAAAQHGELDPRFYVKVCVGLAGAVTHVQGLWRSWGSWFPYCLSKVGRSGFGGWRCGARY